MENFRQFEVGPDPFGRSWLAQFMWLQTAIAMRHSDSVDVKFRLVSGDSVTEKIVVLMHPGLIDLSEMVVYGGVLAGLLNSLLQVVFRLVELIQAEVGPAKAV